MSDSVPDPIPDDIDQRLISSRETLQLLQAIKKIVNPTPQPVEANPT